jgi:hypothetical protein
LAGDRSGAEAGYRKFVRLMSAGEGRRPELAIAKKLLKG